LDSSIALLQIKIKQEQRGKIRPTTVLLLHDTGGNEEDMIPLGQQIVPGAAILSPRGKVLRTASLPSLDE
jgi:predicted esterase